MPKTPSTYIRGDKSRKIRLESGAEAPWVKKKSLPLWIAVSANDQTSGVSWLRHVDYAAYELYLPALRNSIFVEKGKQLRIVLNKERQAKEVYRVWRCWKVKTKVFALHTDKHSEKITGRDRVGMTWRHWPRSICGKRITGSRNSSFSDDKLRFQFYITHTYTSRQTKCDFRWAITIFLYIRP